MSTFLKLKAIDVALVDESSDRVASAVESVFPAHIDRQHVSRIAACVNACCGIEDPAAEITRLMKCELELIRMLELLKASCESENVGPIVKKELPPSASMR